MNAKLFFQSSSGGLLLMFFSALGFSVMGIFVQKLTHSGIPSSELVFVRAIGQGSIMILPMFLFLRIPLLPAKREVWKWVALRGLLGGTGFMCYFKAIQCLPLGDAITLFSLYPIVTCIMAISFLGEPMTQTKVIAIGMSILGAVMIAQPPFLFGHHALSEEFDSGCVFSGYIAALIGTVFGGGVFLCIRKVGTDAHTAHLLLSWFVFGTLLSCLGMAVHGNAVIPSGSKVFTEMFIMVLIGSFAHFMMNYAGRISPAGPSAIVRSTDSMWAYVWEITVFKITPSVFSLAGAALVLASGIIIGISAGRPSGSGQRGAQFSELREEDEEGQTQQVDEESHEEVVVELSKSVVPLAEHEEDDLVAPLAAGSTDTTDNPG